MVCNEHRVTVDDKSIENPEEDRLFVPMNCEDCGEESSEEIRIGWKYDSEGSEDCSHSTILVNYDSLEIDRLGDKNEFRIFIPGDCEECGARFFHKEDICF